MRRVLDFTDGVKFRAADACTTSERASLDRDALKGIMIFSDHKGDQIVSTQCFEDINDARTMSEAS
jgi:hypothetical protein